MAFAGPPGSEGLLFAVFAKCPLPTGAAGPVCHNVGRGCQAIMPLGNRGILDWRAGDTASPARLARMGQEVICKTVLDRHSPPRCRPNRAGVSMSRSVHGPGPGGKDTVSPQRSVWLCRRGGDRPLAGGSGRKSLAGNRLEARAPGSYCRALGRANYVVRHGDTSWENSCPTWLPCHLSSGLISVSVLVSASNEST